MTIKKRLLSGKQIVMIICLLVSVGILCIKSPISAYASNLSGTGNSTGITGTEQNTSGSTTPQLNIGDSLTVQYDNGNGQVSGTLRILLTLTLIALSPTIILMMTSFTKTIIVLHFTRAALNTQTAPPNQILIGLALILTFFIMEPTVTRIYEEAYLPMEEGTITQEEALTAAVQPLRDFMYGETQEDDARIFMEIAQIEWDGSLESIPTSVLIPSFLISQLREAFIIGFIIYIPFIVIDMVVASTLMSMGMMMLPPTTISMPFKILLFVMADGWNLIIVKLLKTFY